MIPSAAKRGALVAVTLAGVVLMVVDFTGLGGSVERGCAPSDAPSGRAALLAAGFVPTNSGQGLICGIDAKPDPCPATFNGSFWSCWHSASNGSWTSYQVGADASHPVSGELEGWRYNDGATGPGIGAPLFIALGAAAVVILVVLLLAARSRRRRSAAGD